MGLLRRIEDTVTGEAAPAETGTSRKVPGVLKEKIAQYHSIYRDLNCILIEIPDHTGDKINMCKRISKIIDKNGTVITLPSGQPLVLLPPSMDHELIAHRLVRSLDVKALLSFEADSPEKVISRLSFLF